MHEKQINSGNELSFVEKEYACRFVHKGLQLLSDVFSRSMDIRHLFSIYFT